jgi:hypothetical protein
LGEEQPDGGRGSHGGPRHLLIARRERIHDVVPTQAPERDLQHDYEDR